MFQVLQCSFFYFKFYKNVQFLLLKFLNFNLCNNIDYIYFDASNMFDYIHILDTKIIKIFKE